MRPKAFIYVALICCCACQHLTIHRGSGEPTAGGTSTMISADSYLWGVARGSSLPRESELCPKSRIETVDMKMTGKDVLWTLLTLGLYVPYRVVVTCSTPLEKQTSRL
jgi:Bor protein